jgi:hypothetical protein
MIHTNWSNSARDENADGPDQQPGGNLSDRDRRPGDRYAVPDRTTLLAVYGRSGVFLRRIPALRIFTCGALAA